MKYLSSIISILIFTCIQGQTFRVFENDTINYIDTEDLKQGLWILKDQNGLNRMQCHYTDNVVSSDILYFHENNIRLIFQPTDDQDFKWIYFRNETDTLYGQTKNIDSKFTFLNNEGEPIEDDLRKELSELSEVYPIFYGGDEARDSFIINSIVYPKKALKKGKAGKILIQFTINQNGNLTDIKVIQSSNELFNEEAIRVIASMPAWQPGHQRGKMVRVRMMIPINFNP